MVLTPEQEKHFCYLPFVQLLMQPTGDISPCCWNQDIVLGQVPGDTLEDIWNGEKIRRLRREFLEGRPVQCQKFMREIRCHTFNRGAYKHAMEFSEIQTKGPRRLDVRLNGRCNIQCVMCDVWQQPNGIYDTSDFWTAGPAEIFPYLMEVDVLGGEPFIQGDTYRLIDEVGKVNSACSWAFVTNGNYNVQPILKKLEKLEIRWLMLSLDSIVPETYAKIRKGGNLLRTLETINGLAKFNEERRAQGRAFDFSISMCVQKENWREMEMFFDYCRFVNVRPWLQFAYGPREVSLLDLPQAERHAIVDHLSTMAGDYSFELLNAIISPLQDSLKEPEALVEARA